MRAKKFRKTPRRSTSGKSRSKIQKKSPRQKKWVCGPIRDIESKILGEGDFKIWEYIIKNKGGMDETRFGC